MLAQRLGERLLDVILHGRIEREHDVIAVAGRDILRALRHDLALVCVRLARAPTAHARELTVHRELDATHRLVVALIEKTDHVRRERFVRVLALLVIQLVGINRLRARGEEGRGHAIRRLLQGRGIRLRRQLRELRRARFELQHRQLRPHFLPRLVRHLVFQEHKFVGHPTALFIESVPLLQQRQQRRLGNVEQGRNHPRQLRRGIANEPRVGADGFDKLAARQHAAAHVANLTAPRLAQDFLIVIGRRRAGVFLVRKSLQIHEPPGQQHKTAAQQPGQKSQAAEHRSSEVGFHASGGWR